MRSPGTNQEYASDRDRLIADCRTWLIVVVHRVGFFLGLGLAARLHPPVWLLPTVVLAVGFILVTASFEKVKVFHQ